MEKKLKGKTAIVMNGDVGIGQAVAIEFARQGADVVIHYMFDEDGAQQTFHHVQRQGQKALVVQANILEAQQVESMFESVSSMFGDIYAMVNNASFEQVAGEMGNPPLRDVYQACARCFIKHRIKVGGQGKLIQIVPVLPTIAAGSADAVQEVAQLMRQLALDVAAQQICVNNLAVGAVKTVSQQLQEQDVPMQRFARPDEIAKLALVLASSETDYCTGTTFTIDGGLSLKI